jgi:hypothetical protein
VLAATLVAALLALPCSSALANDTLRVVSYNTLNYPGSTSSIRNPEFRKILRRIDPDVAVLQEMTSSAGMDEFRTQVMNVIYPGRYVAVPFNDGPDTDNGLFVDSSKVTFLGVVYIATALRDIAEYTIRIRSSGDTMRIYSLHLKASSGTANEQDRLAEATILRNRTNTLPTGSLFIVVGDYNIYRSSEPAFEKLLGSEADNDGRCFDQLNLVGTWNDASFAPYHTQSPRVRSFDGGSTGGMDDRFDIMLSSQAMTSRLLTSSITPFGNDGNHYNDSINHLPNTAVPDSIANALHNASDHLPVYGDIVFTGGPALLAPIAVTDTASSITATSAVLHGEVNPRGSATSARFAWGRGTALTDTTTAQNVGSGTTLVALNASVSGLSADTTYSFRLLAANAGGSAQGSVNTLATLPFPPSPPALVAPASNAIVPAGPVGLVWRSLGGGITYRLQLDNDSLFALPVLVDSLLTDTTALFSGLTVGTRYSWRVSASNEGGAGAFSVARAFNVDAGVSADFAVTAGWNLLSLPFDVANPARAVVYPQSVSHAYAFSPDNGYVEQDSLIGGAGFWLKFDAGTMVTVSGVELSSIAIPVQAGWNLIGMISSPVDVGMIQSTPPGIINSAFYGYGGNYSAVETLLPGYGYWVKCSASGTLTITPALLQHRTH